MSTKQIDTRLETPWVLMNPGPINLADEVRLALLSPDLCHREPEFQVLLERVRKKILQAFAIEDDYTVGLLAGSGTAAVEAMLVSGMPAEGTMVTIENGVYGERMTKICQASGIDVAPYHLDWGQAVDYEALEKVIISNGKVKALAAIHHETTTGLVNDIAKLGEIAKKHNLYFFVDTVSGMAAEEIDLKASGVTMAACTANKAIHGVPGVSFVVTTKEHYAAMKEHPVRSVYFNLPNYIEVQDKGSIPFTMPVHVMYAFDVALDLLIRETVDGRIARFKKRSQTVRDALSEKYEFYIARELFGNTMTSFKLPDGLTYDTIHDTLKENKIIIYAGQGGLPIFRIAHLGEYNEDDVLPNLIDIMMNKL